MARKRMLWQLYFPYLVIIVLSVIALAWYAVRSQRHFYLEQTAEELEARARIITRQITPLINSGNYDEIDALCKDLKQKANTRFTIVLPSGEVVGDSDEDPSRMENHGNRPEIVDVFIKGEGLSIRYSGTLQRTMMYRAIPVKVNDKLTVIVRTSLPLTFIDDALNDIRFKMTLGGLLIALLAAVISFLVARRISSPLEHLKRGAERFSRGYLQSKLAVPDSEEIGSLAEAMNEMAAELNDRISTITRQSMEQEAILLSMAEGVLAVDQDERIININQTAAEFFGLYPSEVTRKLLQETIRNTALQQLVTGVLENKDSATRTIDVSEPRNRYLQASGSVIRDVDGEAIGAVVVLNDITRLRELENLRRDFVANVSHELRTPITSIQGFVETLQDGAVENAEDAKRFLEIIARQADRLNTIIEDLLSLSRIEQAPEIHFITGNIKEIINAAAQTCASNARNKNITVTVDCPADLNIKINQNLLEQALVNLLDNAIKYSPAGSQVTARAVRGDKEITISIIDNGAGIEAKHLPRIFERFYRVDKARSRELGGSGLGLAIVKHIALAHNGRITVESTPGKGSTFTLYLPLR
ncbi:MAG: two-component system histidine kinase PnpS [Candidatus Zixiibacteriota bacterium]